MDLLPQHGLMFSGAASVQMNARCVVIQMDGLLFITNPAGRWRVVNPQGDLTLIQGRWSVNLPRTRPDVFLTLQKAYQASRMALPPLAQPLSKESECSYTRTTATG